MHAERPSPPTSRAWIPVSPSSSDWVPGHAGRSGRAPGAVSCPLLAAEERSSAGGRRAPGSTASTLGAPTARWLGTGLERIDPAVAQSELLQLWLRAFGPATETDIRWWTGWTAREARAALAARPHVEVDLGHATGIALADDLASTMPPEPWAALLPTLDPTTMGWKERDWYLGPHASVLFDGNGNAGPTVWWDGRVVGGWSQRRDGEIAYELLEDVGADAVARSRSRRNDFGRGSDRCGSRRASCRPFSARSRARGRGSSASRLRWPPRRGERRAPRAST